MPELLLELLSEEIPARMQVRAADDLKRLVTDGLKEAGLDFGHAEAFVTPRRLALVVKDLPTETKAGKVEKRGPRVGSPEQAVEGFLKSVARQSVDDEDIQKRETDKGEFYFFEALVAPKPTARELPLMLGNAIDALPWPKSMRWRDTDISWVRPLHSILAVFDGEPLALDYDLNREVGNAVEPNLETRISANNITFGHRFLAPEPIQVRNFDDYVHKLHQAKVVLDHQERCQIIGANAMQLAEEAGLKLREDHALLHEVAGLVEWPVVLMGEIDARFMDLPEEVLTTTMRNHQKYFACEDAKGKLANRFIMVANTETADGGAAIVAGNERVLSARLADAKFFWDQDLGETLESRVFDLVDRVFHARLGSVLDKSRRVERLADEIAEAVGADPEKVFDAASLAKADLSTGMVGEFPELQGIMGRYYALHDGEDAEVADAIAEHYAPQGPNDTCPTKPLSVAIALADKIDSLAAFFAIGEQPTGSKDPFALRRAALGVIRLILENGIRLSLHNVLDAAFEILAEQLEIETGDDMTAKLQVFFFDRLKVHLRDQGHRHDLIDAVFSGGSDDDLLRIVRKAEVLGRFLDTDDGANLLVAYRRANNIVQIEEKKDGRSYLETPDENLFDQEEEHMVWKALNDASRAGGAMHDMTGFEQAVRALAGLRGPVDVLFDEVTVNADNAVLRENRLKLLSEISATMNRVADFSRIEGGER